MIDSPSNTEDRTAAALTHASGIILGFIVPLIVWLVSRESKAWLAAQAKEALNFQITILILYIAIIIVNTVMFHTLFILYTVLWIVNIIFCIVAAVAAGKAKTTPIRSRCA